MVRGRALRVPFKSVGLRVQGDRTKMGTCTWARKMSTTSERTVARTGRAVQLVHELCPATPQASQPALLAPSWSCQASDQEAEEWGIWGLEVLAVITDTLLQHFLCT